MNKKERRTSFEAETTRIDDLIFSNASINNYELDLFFFTN